MKTGKKKIRVLLADDHPVVLTGVKNSLSAYDHIEVVDEASNGREVLRKVKESSPDIILMDISMPVMNGLEVTRRLHKSYPKIKVLAFTMHDDKEYVVEIVRSGARGYVLKETSPLELVRAIEVVSAGDAFFSPAISSVLLKQFISSEKKRKKRRPTQITKREGEVLALIADEYTNKEIAERLGVSIRTIETHRERIMFKLDIHTVAGLTKFAIRHGMLKVK